jgi:A/G-specific adenine glycosylase
MDLGATVCTARAPRCTLCPLAESCVAFRQGDPSRYPVKTRRLKRTQRRNALLWLVQGDRQWLVRRPDAGVWAGLWTLPLFDSIDDVTRATEGWPGRGEALAPIDHALTHFDWRLEPWRHQLPERLAAKRREGIETWLPTGGWFTAAQAQALGLPAPIRKLIAR